MDISFAGDNRSNVRTVTTVVKHLIQASMKKNMNDRTMEETLLSFLGNKPNADMAECESKPADMQEQAIEAVQGQNCESENPQPNRRISGRQRRASLEEYKETFLPVPTIEDRKPVFLSRSTRDALDRIVRMFGERRMSVSGLVENITRQHLAAYGEDIDAWRKL